MKRGEGTVLYLTADSPLRFYFTLERKATGCRAAGLSVGAAAPPSPVLHAAAEGLAGGLRGKNIHEQASDTCICSSLFHVLLRRLRHIGAPYREHSYDWSPISSQDWPGRSQHSCSCGVTGTCSSWSFWCPWHTRPGPPQGHEEWVVRISGVSSPWFFPPAAAFSVCMEDLAIKHLANCFHRVNHEF